MNTDYLIRRIEDIINNLTPLQSAMEDDGLDSYAGEIEEALVNLNALIFSINYAFKSTL